MKLPWYSAFRAVSVDYIHARQFNERAVLSACPEIDRAPDYDIVNGTNVTAIPITPLR